MKRVTIIGSTGSIGTQTLNIIRRNKDKYKIVALTAANNEELLINQAEEFLPDFIGINGKFTRPSAAKKVEGLDSSEVLAAAAADIVVVASVGLAALAPVMAAIKNGKRVALANKEALVSAGDIIMREAKLSGAEIIPIDSEHSALFQCLAAGRREDVRRLVLTASGGPFYSTPANELAGITPAQAVKHPTWNMGKKISVDSATMMNKGLEIIEAHRLYNVADIDYVIHPESIIHSLVEYIDGSTFAQLSYPNMELAIQYALTYPDRHECPNVKPFDFTRPLTFLPRRADFRAPELAIGCIKEGGTAPTIYNSANEAAVNLFLNNKIKFTDIVNIVEDELNRHITEHNYDIGRLVQLHSEIIMKVDRERGR